jgi:hypothetical protein
MKKRGLEMTQLVGPEPSFISNEAWKQELDQILL